MKKKTGNKIEERMKNELQYGIDYNEYHAQIMGFTSGGASFGITWEEAENMDESVNREDEEDELDFFQKELNEQEDDLDCNERSKEDETDDLPF